ncbi:MAG: peptidylprolyl isomerase [Clostridia bacterium]|nr:peptidylprolyl isomerase [Clostridia bacterium]
MKKSIIFLLCASLLFMIAACGNTTETPEATAVPEATEAPAETAAPEETTDKETEKVMVEITMENGGVMELELYPDIAPITVENFVKLANEGFYDGLTFHRIIKGFMIQGGDPEGTGMGGSDTNIKGEFTSNGVKNDLKHERGVISMARAQDPNSASSQFFIVHEDSLFLDGQYAAFGKMTSGFEVLDSLAETPVLDSNGTVAPENQPKIKSIKIK